VAALEQSKRLERMSDSNLVSFFAQELLEIDSGAPASNLLNSNITKNLVRMGILEPAIRSGHGSRGLALTDKARGLLLENR